MKRLSYIGKVDDTGKLIGPASERIREEMRDTFAGQFVFIEVYGWISKPSAGLRGYYFVEIIPGVLRGLRDLGNRVDPNRKDHQDQCHEMLKGMFLESEVVVDAEGISHTMPPTTKNLSGKGWQNYLDEITQWAQEYLGITFAPPIKKRKK